MNVLGVCLSILHGQSYLQELCHFSFQGAVQCFSTLVKVSIEAKSVRFLLHLQWDVNGMADQIDF